MKFESDLSLVGVQTLASLVWTALFSIPILIPFFPLGFCFLASFLLTFLSLCRFLLHGEVRKVEYAPVFHFIRSVVFASPTHALHGIAIGLLISAWGNRPDDDGFLFSDDFFSYFLLAWSFSTSVLLEKRNRFSLANRLPRSRFQTIVSSYASSVLPSVLVLSVCLGGGLLQSLSLEYVALLLSLSQSELIFHIIVSESKSRELNQVALKYVEPGSLHESFRCVPLFTGVLSTPLHDVFLFSNVLKTDESMEAFWGRKRTQVEFEAKSTWQNTEALIALSKERFSLLSQAIYIAEAKRLGSVFAMRSNGAVFRGLFELQRLQALEYITSKKEEQEMLVNVCLDFLDTQALKLQTFCRVLNVQLPRNAETGLEEADAWTRDCGIHPIDQAFLYYHRKWFGKLWFRRLLWGQLVWEFDPIFSENERRLHNNKVIPSDPPQRVVSGLLDEFELLVKASSTVVRLAKQSRKREWESLVRFSLERLLLACQEAEDKLGQDSGEGLFYQMKFSLEADLHGLQ